jgi:hypothetical protein
VKRRRKQPDKALQAVLSGTWRDTPEQQDARDARTLLSCIAAALNAFEHAGYTAKLAHGAVLTDVGYVLPVFPDAGERWAVRTMALTEFPVLPDSGDED